MGQIVSAKSLEFYKKTIVELTSNWTNGVCWGGVYYADGPRADTEVTAAHTACHAWVTNAYGIACMGQKSSYYLGTWDKEYSNDANNIVILSCHRKGSVSKKTSDFLIKWLARESPFSEHVLNRDDDKSLTEGGLILLGGPAGLTVSQAMWLCKVTRFTTEGGQSAETFRRLVEAGVDGMLAIYVASHVRKVSSTGFTYTGTEGHSTVIKQKTDVVGMIQRNLNMKAGDTGTVFERKGGFRQNRYFDVSDRIHGFCRPTKVSDGWGGQVERSAANKESFIENVKEMERELLNFCQPNIPQPMPDSNTVYLDLDL